MPDTTPTITFNPDHSLDGDMLSAISLRLTKPSPSSASTPSRLSDVDRAEYLAMLRGEYPSEALPDEQAHKLLDQLYAIMVAFVDLGFGLGSGISADRNKSSSNRGAACGKVNQKTPSKCDKPARAMVNSFYPETDQKDKARAASSLASGKEDS